MYKFIDSKIQYLNHSFTKETIPFPIVGFTVSIYAIENLKFKKKDNVVSGGNVVITLIWICGFCIFKLNSF